jgi:hypothetical protein
MILFLLGVIERRAATVSRGLAIMRQNQELTDDELNQLQAEADAYFQSDAALTDEQLRARREGGGR